MDLTFAAALAVGVAGPILFKGWGGSLVHWLGYFLATALKYVNAPLAFLYAFLERHHWKRLILTSGLAFAIVWLLPLTYFRSSLQVSFVYHAQRGLQVESTPAVLASAINTFTRSEAFTEAYKNYEITGPVSTTVKQIFDKLFPAALMLVILYGLWVIWKNERMTAQLARHGLTLLYIFVFMITAKVLSTPFLLWHIPLVGMYPFKNLKSQLWFTIPSALIIALSMTYIPRVPVLLFDSHQLIGISRSRLFGLLAYQTWELIYKGADAK
jgi:hypothetical protein